MKPVRVKICGITRVEDAKAAAYAGADAIGLVFYPPSPRSVDIPSALTILEGLPPFVSVVALFVNPTDSEVMNVLNALPIDILQFHGDETPEFCQQFNRPWLKAIKVQTAEQLERDLMTYSNANGVLLDTYMDGVAGGTGNTFDWSLIPDNISRAWILAGGLTPDNITDALNQCTPWAVDVSGGVEITGRKGLKDTVKIESFINRSKYFKV